VARQLLGQPGIHWPPAGPILVWLVVLFMVAWLSYRFLERPLLRLRTRFDGTRANGNPNRSKPR